jgi:hypothetical protein
MLLQGRCFNCLVLGFALLFAATRPAYPSALVGVHDFRPLVTGQPSLSDEQRQYPALVYEFEGLAFTADGSLWASVAANLSGGSKELWQLDLATTTRSAMPHPGLLGGLLPLATYGNPVGLTSVGDQLVVGHNFKQFGNLIGLLDVSSRTWSARFGVGWLRRGGRWFRLGVGQGDGGQRNHAAMAPLGGMHGAQGNDKLNARDVGAAWGQADRRHAASRSCRRASSTSH